jgi:protoheme ferro-lyase
MITPNTAAAIAQLPLEGDTYQRTIRQAARALVTKGRTDYRYYTQYVSGMTVWLAPDGAEGSVSVTSEGVVRE